METELGQAAHKPTVADQPIDKTTAKSIILQEATLAKKVHFRRINMYIDNTYLAGTLNMILRDENGKVKLNGNVKLN